MKTLYTIYTSFAKRMVLTLTLLFTLGVTSAWATEYEEMLVLDVAKNAPTGSTTTAMEADAILLYLENASETKNEIKSVTDVSGKVYMGKGTGGDGIPQACLKIGKASEAAGFTFTIADTFDDVSKVTIIGYGWKTSTVVSVNESAGQKPTKAATEVSFDYVLTSPTKTIKIYVGSSAFCATQIILYKEAASKCAYTVTFNSNYGTNSTSSQEFTCGETKALTANSFSRTGYTFTEWNTQANGTGTSYTDQQLVNLSSTNNDNIPLFAQWKINSYKVTWKPNGGNWSGNASDKVEDYNYGATITTPTNPTRYGYDFTGWNPTPATTMPASDQTYTAQWREQSLTNYRTSCTTETIVTFELNGGSGIFDDVTLNSNTYAIPGTEPTRNGYNFTGWKIQGGDETIYKYGTSNSSISNITESITLVAQWSAIEYTITYNLNGGSGVSNTIYTIESNDITLPTPTHEQGLTFVGWYESADFTGNAVSVITHGSTGNKVFYAKWEKSTPTFAWSVASYTAALEADNTFPTLNNPNGLSVTYTSSNNGVATIDANGNITLVATGTTTITAIGAESATHKSATATYELTVNPSNCKWVETDITNINSGDKVVVTMTTAGGVTYALPSEQSTGSNPEAISVTVVDGNTLKAVPTTIVWIINKEEDNLTFESLNHAGYFLDCTNDNAGVRVSNGTNRNRNFVIDPTSGYLKNTQTTDARYLGVHNTNYDWCCYKTYGNNTGGQTLKFYKKECLPANEYWVDYNLENVTCTTNPLVETVTSTSEDFELTFEAADGYILTDDIEVQMVGGTLTTTWDKDNGVLTINKPDGGFTGNITISLAACLSLPAPQNLAETDITSSSVTLTWDAVKNAQSYEVLVLDENNDEIAKTTTKCQITLTDLQVNSYYVWGVVPVADGYCGIQETSDFTTLQTYTVTFDSNGHANAEFMPAEQTIDDGSYAQSPNDDPEDNGYSFVGWYDNKNCEGAAFDFENTAITENTTLYAKWNVVTYNITYAGLEDATNHANNPATYTIETPTITFLAPSTRDGYIFSGWSPAALEKGNYGNKTITATWEKGKIVTWKADGNVIEQQTYASGDKLVIPTQEIEACQGSEFVGWTDDENYSHATDAPAYITAGSAVTTDATYYAVYAEETEGDEIILAIGAETDNSNGNATYAYAIEVEGFSLVANKGAGQTNPTFNESNNDARIYAKGSITLTAPKNLTSIVFNISTQGKKRLAPISASVGAIATQASGDAIVVWTGNASEVTFTVGEKANYGSDGSSNAGQLCFENIVVTSESSYTNYSTSCIPTYHVNYELAGGENGCADEGVKVGNNYTICGDEPTKTGYTFQHWTDGTNTYEAGATIENVQSNITLTAVWEANTYTITWMANGEEYTTTTHTYDQTLEILSEPYTCYGTKTFMGWTETPSVNENGEGIEYITTSTNPSENKTYYAVFADVTNNGSGGYDKVTEALDDYSGEFLIVYEAGNKAFNGGLSTLDATSNGIDVTINNNTIESNQTTDAAKFTIAAINDGYSIKSASGKYIGRTANENELDESTSTIYTNTISINNDKSINIIGSGSAYLRYNTDGSRFRYYKSSTYSSQQVIALYKKSAGATLTNYTTTPTGCPEIVVAESAYVTSANAQSVKVNVPVTANNFTNDMTITAAVEDGNFSVANVSAIADGACTVTLAYKPTSPKTTESANVTLTAKAGDNEVTSTTFTLNGRSLPETFAVVAKVGNMWYALPEVGYEAGKHATAYPVEVDNIADPTAVTSAVANNAAWSLRQVYEAQKSNAQHDRYETSGTNFVLENKQTPAKLLNASAQGDKGSNNYLLTSAQYDNYYSTNPGLYEWTPTTTDLETYTLTNVQRTDKQINISKNAVFGLHAADVVTSELRFLPITGTYAAIDIQVVEWYADKVLIRSNSAITSVTAVINGTEYTAAVASKDNALYEISNIPFAANPAQVVTLNFTVGAETLTKIIAVPVILSRTTASTTDDLFTNITKEIYNYTDLVVRDGSVLTVNGTVAGNTFYDVTIYPTAKIVVPEKNKSENNNKLSVNRLTFIGGITEVYDGEKYVIDKYSVPELSLKGVLNKSVTTMDYAMRVDLDQMYQMGVPYDVNLVEITYWDGSAIELGEELYVSAYDGQARANRESKTWLWETEFAEPTLKAGVGYTISAEPQTNGDKYAILRLPMKSNISSGSTEEAKSINVVAYDNTKGVTITDNHKGWNYLSNPYMTTISGGEADTKLVLGYLKETGTGPWEWVNDEIRYVTIPHDNGKDYYQKKFSEAELKPFKSFFVQIAQGGELSFALASRQNAPARYMEVQTEQEVEFEILLSNEKQSDNTGLLIAEQYSPAYEINADLEKMTGSMSVYTIYGGHKLAYNALSPINASEWIPLGYIAPNAGEYSYKVDKADQVMEQVQHIYLIDYDNNSITDLINNEYKFYTSKGKNETRFAINVVMQVDKDNTTTGVDMLLNDHNAPIKFIHQDKMYIQNGGTIYDATGKQVTNINK